MQRCQGAWGVVFPEVQHEGHLLLGLKPGGLESAQSMLKTEMPTHRCPASVLPLSHTLPP